MKNKDLAEEDLNKVADSAIYFKNGRFPNMSLYQGIDIKAAFNAGRESVVENISELKWANVFEDRAYTAAFSFGLSYRIEFAYNKFTLFCNSVYINCFVSLSATKQAANEDYKKRLIQALGL